MVNLIMHIGKLMRAWNAKIKRHNYLYLHETLHPRSKIITLKTLDKEMRA